MGTAEVTYVSQMLRVGPGCPDEPHKHALSAADAALLIDDHHTVAVVPDEDTAVQALLLLMDQPDANWARGHVRLRRHPVADLSLFPTP